MLKWIVGSKVDHPLADVKQARTLISELPPYDAVRALDEITGWLESLPEAEGFKLDRMYEVVDQLDLASRNHQKKLLADYLAMPRQQKFHENKLWTCGYRFAKALGNTYLFIVRQHDANATGAAAIRKHMPVIVARGLRSLALQVKWIMLRYGPFEPGLWPAIGELYRRAEAGGYANTALTIYPGLHGSGTVQQEYLKLMLVWGSSADVLPPLKQEIVERTVSDLAASFRLEAQPFAGATYAFDPARNRPPVRLFGDAKAGENLHYFSAGDAREKLGAAMPVLEKTGKLPTDINLGQAYPADAVLDVFRHLNTYWSDTPPVRMSERRPATARITVVPGYLQLVDELERDETDALNFSVSGAESWVVKDVSDTGYGALVPAATADWVRIDELIGVQGEGSAQWGIALVRRVFRDEQRQYHVGVEVISRAVTLARVTHAAGREPETAVALAPEPDENGEVSLMMRAGRFDPGAQIEMSVRDRNYTLVPTRMVDAGDDFDWATYRITR